MHKFYAIPAVICLVLCVFAANRPVFAGDVHDPAPLLEPIRTQYQLPAMAAAVIKDGKLHAVGAAGVRKAGDKTPVTADDQFHLGSCTKAMTATLIGILIEQGKLTWQTTLADAFPEMDAMHPDYRAVTIAQLLAHRGGFPPPEQSWPKGQTFHQMHFLPGPPMQQRREYTRLMLAQAPAVQPGTAYLYSNAGYAIAGAIAEQVTGTPWETLMRELIFEPLGMKTAGFGAMGTPETIDQPYQHKTIFGKSLAVEPGPTSDNPPVIGPGGTVHCSMGDWARFVIAHLQAEKEDTALMKQETARKLHTPAFDGEYAGGWMVTERDWAGGRVLTHAGSNTMNFAVVWMAPNRDFAVLVATNQGGEKAEEACDKAAAALIET
jgi:CubicO group peptidase (beta-lactamase class C family)